MTFRFVFVLMAGFVAACGPSPVPGETAEVTGPRPAEAIAEAATTESQALPASATAPANDPPATDDPAPRPAALIAGAQLSEGRRRTGALLAEPTEEILAEAQSRSEVRSGREAWQEKMTVPISGASGLPRPERLEVSLLTYGHVDSTVSSAQLILPEGGAVDLPSYGFTYERSALGVYAVDGTRVDVSPLEDFPLWIDLAETNGRMTLQYFTLAQEIARASFISPLTELPAAVYPSPGTDASPLLEISEAQTQSDGVAPVYTIFPVGEISDDGEWIKVRVNYAVDTWCGDAALQPDLEGWVRWRRADGAPRIYWQAAYSC